MFIWWFSKNVVILSVGNEILILHLNYPNYSTMKNIIDRIIVLLFIFTMFFLMVVSAHAGNRYFFSSQTMPSSISLDDVTITPTKKSGTVNLLNQKIFDVDVSCYARVRSDENNATKFTINAKTDGVLLVYYTRSWSTSAGPVDNDVDDLNIVGNNGFAEYFSTATSPILGIKYYILKAGVSYTMTSTGYTCGVYGFVYMPGNVAVYNPRGKGGHELIGQYCDSYANLPNLSGDGWHFGGWYKDDACTEPVQENEGINEPTIIFAHWIKTPTVDVWDFVNYPTTELRNGHTLEWDGLVVYGSKEQGSSTGIGNEGLTFFKQGSKDYDHATFIPKYDGELTLTYKASSTTTPIRWCVVGLDVVDDLEDVEKKKLVVACGSANPDAETYKTLQAKLEAGKKYYIYQIGKGIYIPKMQYVASASSAVVSGDNVSFTTTANMQGWRAFYDKDYSYTVDANTKVYMVVNSEVNGEVKFSNRTGNKVPKDCAVVLHTDALQADGTYLITMTKDATPYVYEGSDNLLRHSIEGETVDAYRLGYRSGEGNGVAFYPWSTTNSSEGIVYLYQPNNNGNAKIAFEIEESATGISSVQKEPNECNFVFNLNGQRMAAPRKGFNIINGKKYIVR